MIGVPTAVTIGRPMVDGVTADARADPGLRAGAIARACPDAFLAEVLAAESDY